MCSESMALHQHGHASPLQLLRTQDFECFLTFLHGQIEALALRPKHLFQDPEKDRSLLGRLAKWTGVITTDFFSARGDGECLETAAHSRQFYTIVGILAFCLQFKAPSTHC